MGENKTELRYFGTKITNQILIKEKLQGDLILVMLATIQSKTFVVSFADENSKN
jgi:hypothetical protein